MYIIVDSFILYDSIYSMYSPCLIVLLKLYQKNEDEYFNSFHIFLDNCALFIQMVHQWYMRMENICLLYINIDNSHVAVYETLLLSLSIVKSNDFLFFFFNLSNNFILCFFFRHFEFPKPHLIFISFFSFFSVFHFFICLLSTFYYFSWKAWTC